MIDYSKVTIIKSSLMKDFYNYINSMPQEIPTPPFLVDVNLISANNGDLIKEYNKAFKSAQYIMLSRKRKLLPSNETYEWIDQYTFRLFGGEGCSLRDIQIQPKEWFYKDGVISTYFGDTPITLEISERKLIDIINMN